MKTACEHQRAVAEFKIHEEGLPNSLVFVPKCQEDGKFFEVQCSIVNQNCWCVDGNGIKISGTHSYNSTPPNCGNPAKCSELNCDIICEYGYELDSTGCPVCHCHDPCSDLICNDNEECRMAQVTCISSPCPPIPICLPKIDNPCPHGEPYEDPVSKNIVKCGPHDMRCPSTHQCHLSPLGEYAVCCPKSHDVCFESPDPGHCMALIPRWNFEPNENACVEFQYGGCGGNLNNFQTKEDCERVCPVLSNCEQVRENSLKLGSSFIPRCNVQTKSWEPVQCIDSIGICWCVNSQGEEIAGSRVRGQSQCTSRAGRKFAESEHLKICEHDIAHVCDPSACNNKICLAYPDAICRLDPCGGCTLKFYNSSGTVVDCNEGFGSCQLELQQALNSDSWSNEYAAAFLPKEEDLLVPLPQFVQSNSNSKTLINKRDLLSSTLSFLKSLMQGVTQDTAKESSELSSLSLLDELPADRYVNLPLEMGVVLPLCMANGEYSPLQSYKSLKWCSTPDGTPIHDSLTQGYLECSSNGSVLQKDSKQFCANGLKPTRVCKIECMNAECPSHPSAICSADPCNNCEITFTSVEGKPVDCQDKCLQPIEVGVCRASFRNWFYNQTSRECEEFIFGGCLGNDNNFDSYASCVSECKKPVDICRLPKQIGMCRASMHRWYYNHLTKRCEEFIYGGCDGNENNFETEEECEAICPDLILCNNLGNDKMLRVCSRREACRNKVCLDHEDVVCTVDACDNCKAVFVDLDGIQVDCNNYTDKINHIPTVVTENYNTSTDKDVFIVHVKRKTRCQKQRMWAVLHGGHVPDCDKNGRFEPTQCDERNEEELQPFCWCVDEAGNQVQGTVHFIKGSYECKHTKILKIEVTLVFSQPMDNPLLPNTSIITKAVEKIVPNSGPNRNLNVTVLNRSDAIVVQFILDDSDKVDVAYSLEEQIKFGHLALNIDGYTLYAVHSSSTFRHIVVDEEAFESDQSLSSGSVAIIVILCLLTIILISVLVVGVSIYRRKRIGIYPKGSLESLASSTTPLNVYDSKTHLDMSSPLLCNLKNDKDGYKMAISTIEHEYAVISPTLYPSKNVVT